MKNLDVKFSAATNARLVDSKDSDSKPGSRISADKLFSFFTASIIKKRVKFTR